MAFRQYNKEFASFFYYIPENFPETKWKTYIKYCEPIKLNCILKAAKTIYDKNQSIM